MKSSTKLLLLLLSGSTYAREATPQQAGQAAPLAFPTASGTETAPPGIYEPSAPGFDLSRFVRFDGQIRFRYEYFDPFGYAPAQVTTADDAVLMRTRLGALFGLHRHLAARFQIQDSRIWGEEGFATSTSPAGSVTTSLDNLDLHQAYVELKHLFEDFAGEDAVSLRVGRQELSFGDQRLVSPLDWSNVARAWDAARLTIAPPEAPGGLQVDLFASIIRDTSSAATGGGPVGVSTVDEKQAFHGLYVAFRELPPPDLGSWSDGKGQSRPILGSHQLDLYTFYRDLADGSFTAEDGVTTGDVDDVTLGTRLGGELLRNSDGAGFDYSGELAYQIGSFAGDDISAYGYALTAGYTLAGEWLSQTKARVGLEYDYGSGDDDPNDGDRGTFDPLFPFGHKYQGIQDTFSWMNGQDLAFKLDLYPPKVTKISRAELHYHLFWLSQAKDGWFNAGLAQIRRDPTGSSGNFVGSEIDVTLEYILLAPFAVLWLGYSHFLPGDFVQETGSEPSRDFVFAQLSVTF